MVISFSRKQANDSALNDLKYYRDEHIAPTVQQIKRKKKILLRQTIYPTLQLSSELLHIYTHSLYQTMVSFMDLDVVPMVVRASNEVLC
jgi:hypothetical protein